METLAQEFLHRVLFSHKEWERNLYAHLLIGLVGQGPDFKNEVANLLTSRSYPREMRCE